MRKIFGIILAVLLFTSAGYSQKINGEFEFRLGGNFQYMPVLGELSNYSSSSIGGGVKAEFDLPVFISDIFEIGIPVNASFGANLLKTDLLKSMMNMQFTSGFYGRFTLLYGNLIIQPELDYGLALTLPKVNPLYPNEMASVYADQSFQVVVGFRYAPEEIDFGLMEFELAPVYTLCIENKKLVHYIGGKVGVMFRVY